MKLNDGDDDGMTMMNWNCSFDIISHYRFPLTLAFRVKFSCDEILGSVELLQFYDLRDLHKMSFN